MVTCLYDGGRGGGSRDFVVLDLHQKHMELGQVHQDAISFLLRQTMSGPYIWYNEPITGH